MNAYDHLRAGGWKQRTIDGEPYWEHPKYPLQAWSTSAAIGQELDWVRAELESFKSQLAINCEAYAKLKDELTETRSLLLEAKGSLERSLRLLERDLKTPAEQAVVDAMGEIEIEVLEAIRDKMSAVHPIWIPPALAELARREAAKPSGAMPVIDLFEALKKSLEER